MKSQTVKARLTKSELTALSGLTLGYLGLFDPVGYGNMVTKELMIEILEKMYAMLNNHEQRNFTLRMTGAQSMAFVAFWVRVDLSYSAYERVTINRIIEIIHQNNLYANITPPLS